jgi:hypothetical protein
MQPCIRPKKEYIIDVDFYRPFYEKSYLKKCYLSDLKIIAIEMNIYPDDKNVFCSSRTREELIRDITNVKPEKQSDDENSEEYNYRTQSESRSDFYDENSEEYNYCARSESSSEERSSDFYDN